MRLLLELPWMTRVLTPPPSSPSRYFEQVIQQKQQLCELTSSSTLTLSPPQITFFSTTSFLSVLVFLFDSPSFTQVHHHQLFAITTSPSQTSFSHPLYRTSFFFILIGSLARSLTQNHSYVPSFQIVFLLFSL